MDKTQQLEEIIRETCNLLVVQNDSSSEGMNELITFEHILRTANSRGKFLAINENGHFYDRVRNDENNSSGNYELSKSYQEQKKETKRLLAEIIV